MKIFKYPLESETSEIMMPSIGEILTVQLQGSTPCIWAWVDPEAPMKPVRFHVIATGEEFSPHGKSYVGTFQAGQFVWHVWKSKVRSKGD